MSNKSLPHPAVLSDPGGTGQPAAESGRRRNSAADRLFPDRYLFARAGGTPVCIGPFCTEVFSEQEWGLLLPASQYGSVPLANLVSWRAQFPVMDKADALHKTTVFLNLCSDHPGAWQITELDLTAIRQDSSSHTALQTQSDILEERYSLEQSMYAAIAAGKATEAVRLHRLLEQRIAHIKRQGRTLSTAVIGASMVRNSARLVAFSCGLPALLLDQIATSNTLALQKATSFDEITGLVEQMLRDFANAIYRQKNERYSKLIHCMIYTIEHNYRSDLTVSALAEELEVSPDTLIRRCKKETGLTPNAYLRRVRMNRAAQLLRESRRSVQEVSAEVGILDANYFVKLFKQQFGQTPSVYRAGRLL